VAALLKYLDYKTSASPLLNVHLRIEADHIGVLNEPDLEISSDLT